MTAHGHRPTGRAGRGHPRPPYNDPTLGLALSRPPSLGPQVLGRCDAPTRTQALPRPTFCPGLRLQVNPSGCPSTDPSPLHPPPTPTASASVHPALGRTHLKGHKQNALYVGVNKIYWSGRGCGKDSGLRLGGWRPQGRGRGALRGLVWGPGVLSGWSGGSARGRR